MEKILNILNGSILDSVVNLANSLAGNQLYIPSANYFLGETVEMTKGLLGSYLVHVNDDKKLDICGGKIVEAEAYLDKTDPASHAATAEITERNRIFYEKGGVAYVFHMRGKYYCFNIIVRPKHVAGCVLVRALEPLFGIEKMAKRRNKRPDQLVDLCSGPSKLCQALAIDKSYTGYNLRKSRLLILKSRKKNIKTITSGQRIGISKATDLELRFWEKDSKYVSR